MPERVQKPFDPAPWGPKQGDEGGPRPPDISRPDTKDLLKKMRKVDPNQSKRYRQRKGQKMDKPSLTLDQPFSGAGEDFPEILRRKGLLQPVADLMAGAANRDFVPTESTTILAF